MTAIPRFPAMALHAAAVATANAPVQAQAQAPARRRCLKLGTLAATLALAGSFAGQVQAQASAPGGWPTKTVRMVVGFAPGGTTDVLARVVSQSLTESLGQTVLVDNKPGASGNLAAADVAKATPDGYTFLVAPTSVETANPSLFKSTLLPSRDLTPVMGIGRTQMYVVVRPNLDVKDLRALIAQVKAAPDKYTYASAGTGTPPHLAGELFKQSTGTALTHVPYRGAAPALKARFADLGAEPQALENADFRKLLVQEGKTLSTLIRDRRIIVE